MKELNMEYNSQRESLRISEYGRYVQKLVSAAKKIEKKDVRQAYVEKIIQLMFLLQPNAKNYEDYKEKLWKHIYIIADFDLDVDPPEGITFSHGEYFKKPPTLEYPKPLMEFRHYGNHLKSMINKAILMEDQAKKAAFTELIGNFMKLAYSTYNKEHYINDNIIVNDLNKLSNGNLKFEDNVNLDALTNANPKKNYVQSNPPPKNNKKKSNNNRNKYKRPN
jgi:hypothetical protein